jgi:hypothetical protein
MPIPLATLDDRRTAKRQEGRKRMAARVKKLEARLAKARDVVVQIEAALLRARDDAAWIHPLDYEFEAK